MMEITITERAAEAIREKMGNESRYVKLHYDTEGCCAVNGIPVLWIVSEKEPDEILIETNEFPIVIEKMKMVFFDEKLTIDTAGPGIYRLSSPNEILNARMGLVVK